MELVDRPIGRPPHTFDTIIAQAYGISEHKQLSHGARHAGLHAAHLELANEDVIGLVERLELVT